MEKLAKKRKFSWFIIFSIIVLRENKDDDEMDALALMEMMETPPSEKNSEKKKDQEKKKDPDEQEEKETVMINHGGDDRAYFPLDIPEPDISPRTKGKKAFFAAAKNEEADELSKALLGGAVGLSVDLNSEHPKTTEGFRRSPNTKTLKKSKEQVGTKRDKEEFPFLFAAKERAEERRKEKKEMIKEAKKSKAELTDEGFYDEEFAKIAAKSRKKKSNGIETLTPQEPSAVRTILARAKEVLQSLASDNSKFQAVIDKRARIARNLSSIFEETNSPDVVKKSGMPHVSPADLVAPKPVVRDIVKETAGAFIPVSPPGKAAEMNPIGNIP